MRQVVLHVVFLLYNIQMHDHEHIYNQQLHNTIDSLFHI